MRRTVSIFIALLMLTPAAIAQMQPTVTQSQLECISPNAFTRVNVNAGVPAGETIDHVRVYFRSPLTDGSDWFFVDAMRAGQFWTAILPAPMSGVSQMTYRSEVLLTNGTSVITDIMTVDVDPNCPEVAMEGNPCADASIVIGTTADEPELPDGFNNAGISGVVTEEGTMIAAANVAGFETSGICPGALPFGAAGAPAGGTIMGLPTAGVVAGGLVAAGIAGIAIDNNADRDSSPN